MRMQIEHRQNCCALMFDMEYNSDRNAEAAAHFLTHSTRTRTCFTFHAIIILLSSKTRDAHRRWIFPQSHIAASDRKVTRIHQHRCRCILADIKQSSTLSNGRAFRLHFIPLHYRMPLCFQWHDKQYYCMFELNDEHATHTHTQNYIKWYAPHCTMGSQHSRAHHENMCMWHNRKTNYLIAFGNDNELCQWKERLDSMFAVAIAHQARIRPTIFLPVCVFVLLLQPVLFE